MSDDLKAIVDMTEDRFKLEIMEALVLEASATGEVGIETVVNVAARVAANYGLVTPSDGTPFNPVDDPNTSEF